MNGCCRTNPCLNGGTCTEHCDDVTLKFNCSCVAGFTGKVCERKPSCSSYYAADSAVTNGVYGINNPNSNELFKVYCDFTSESNFVWTLIESFKKSILKGFNYDFYTDKPIRSNDPQSFSAHRLSLSAMTYLLSDTTHIRATCEFNNGFSYTDYLRGKLTEFELITSGGRCTLFEYINIRGINCTDCKAKYWGKAGEHGHIASTVSASCTCPNCVKWTDNIKSEDSFGFYGSANPDHRCVQNNDTTTQWWLGVKVSP